MEVKLDDAMLDKVLGTVVTELLSDESKKELMRDAVTTFLERKTYDGKSKIREIFDAQLNKACERICVEMITKDDRLRAMITDVYNETVGKLRDTMVASLTQHILQRFRY